ncbi:unnamed protein product [Moneuplotes crassus]|uniref:Uncharacterized protein n=1 Tax=Euplotes crassus TaxID=5936 RepID=A0AAD1XVL4_EUPCR|nr:unnamed protein product [Moneuplotes crassus]
METHLRTFIQNNFCGCENKECKSSLSSEVVKLMREEELNKETVKSLISITRGAPKGPRMINVIYSMVHHVSNKKLDKSFFDDLAEFFIISYIKCDEEGKQALHQDMIQFIKLMEDKEKEFNLDDIDITYCMVHLIARRVYTKSENGLKEFNPEDSESYKSFLKRNLKKIDTHLKSKIDGDLTYWNALKGKKKYIRFASLLSLFTFRMLNICTIEADEKNELCSNLLRRVCHLSICAEKEDLYYPISALCSYFTKEAIDQEKIFSLSGSRTMYKRMKIFGKQCMMKWETFIHSLEKKKDENHSITMNMILITIQKVAVQNCDIDAIIKSTRILQDIYNMQISKHKNQHLGLYSQLMCCFLTNFRSLNEMQKEFFFRQMMKIQNILFVHKARAEVTAIYKNLYSQKETSKNFVSLKGIASKSETNYGKPILENFLLNSDIMEDPKLIVILYKMLVPYIAILESSGIKFIKKLREFRLVSWNKDGKLEFCQKRLKKEDSTSNWKDEILNLCVKNSDFWNTSKGPILISIIEFMYGLVKGEISGCIRSLTLLVNLFPEVEENLLPALKEVIEEESKKEGGSNYIYTNFMIRSFKYFKESNRELKEDELFQVLFQHMEDLIRQKDMAKWIPDFMSVWIELMNRNKVDMIIEEARFNSTIQVLSNYDDFRSINNAFPFTFISFAIMKAQKSECKLQDFFKHYYKKLISLISGDDRDQLKFPTLKNRVKSGKLPESKLAKEGSKPVIDINQGAEESKEQPMGEESKDSSHSKEAQRRREIILEKHFTQLKNNAMIKYGRIRNFIENIFVSMHPLIYLINSDVSEEDVKASDRYTVFKPKYCNECGEDLETKSYFSLTSDCEHCLYSNSNLIIPEHIQNSVSWYENKYYLRETTEICIPVDSFTKISSSQKKSLKKMILKLLGEIFHTFIEAVEEEEYRDFFFKQEACLKRLKTPKDFFPIVLTKSVSCALQIYLKIKSEEIFKVPEDLTEAVRKIENISERLASSFKMIQNTIQDIKFTLKAEELFQEFESLDFGEAKEENGAAKDN